MRLSLQHGLSMAIFSNFAGANTEKVIFQAPETINIPNTSPNLGDLRLDMLTPDHWSKRIDLPASFPAPASPFGSPTWLLLKNLTQDQRYELRLCWAATQPTAFTLDVFELPVVWDTPELISSLAKYASSRIANREADNSSASYSTPMEQETSLFFLRVLAAADYYTHNATLMANVEHVRADLILDPFLLNVLPRSLLPTVFYINGVAIMAWFLSRVILIWIQPVLAAEGKPERKKNI
ncbi:hypothetical protein K4K59_009136 [Colletotrichum sp. SAR11_240]|nr:hypothetical protein K4K59_009136 [Colletotrichum sp. SAR11_240]